MAWYSPCMHAFLSLFWLGWERHTAYIADKYARKKTREREQNGREREQNGREREQNGRERGANVAQVGVLVGVGVVLADEAGA